MRRSRRCSPFDQIKPEEYQRVTGVSYLGYIYATMAALKHMKPVTEARSCRLAPRWPTGASHCTAVLRRQTRHQASAALRCELLHDKSNGASRWFSCRP